MTARPDYIVVIGASAGGIEALYHVLPALPVDFPAPVLAVVHLPPEGPNLLPGLFAERCGLPVKEAEDKEPALPGVIYFAPADYHVLVEDDGCLALSCDEEVWFSRPSIDVLFESAAHAWGAKTIGVVLTGANADGAPGLAMIERAGGIAIVENPSTAYAGNMPGAALAACSSAKVMHLNAMAAYITNEVQS